MAKWLIVVLDFVFRVIQEPVTCNSYRFFLSNATDHWSLLFFPYFFPAEPESDSFLFIFKLSLAQL